MTHFSAIVQPLTRFLKLLTKNFPYRPITYTFFCSWFPFPCPVEAFNLACQTFSETEEYQSTPNPEPDAPVTLTPVSCLDCFFGSLTQTIQSALYYYNNIKNNNIEKRNNNNNNSDDSKNSDNSVSDSEPHPEEQTKGELKENLKTNPTGVPTEVSQKLLDLDIHAPYPRWLQHFLTILPSGRVLENLTAVIHHRRKKTAGYNALGAVRKALQDNWQPPTPKHAPTGFVAWFEEMRRKNLVLGSKKTAEGVVVYGRDGEPLGIWPEVVERLRHIQVEPT